MGYSGSASAINLTFDTSTQVSYNAQRSAGGVQNFELGFGGEGFGNKIYLYGQTTIAGQDTTGENRSVRLGETLNRRAFITGTPPQGVCGDNENPYLDACYTQDDQGNKETELWRPHNEGVIYASSLQVDSYALRHPESKKLVGYELDFSNAINTQQVINFNINPAYQVAGSLDGFIGNQRVPSLNNGKPYRSYFRPNQERTWLDRYERQYQELEERYNQTGSLADLDGDQFVNDSLLIARTSVADGGCQVQETRTAASVTDYFGNNIDFSLTAGLDYEAIAAIVKFKSSTGFTFNRQYTQSKDNDRSIEFSPDLTCDITSGVQNADNQTLPWSVNAYAVRSYFLPASIQNYSQLFEEVMDYNNPGDSTSALRQVLEQARKSPRKIWRIVHRVDAVSRVMADPFAS